MSVISVCLRHWMLSFVSVCQQHSQICAQRTQAPYCYPQWRPPQSFPYSSVKIHFAPKPTKNLSAYATHKIEHNAHSHCCHPTMCCSQRFTYFSVKKIHSVLPKPTMHSPTELLQIRFTWINPLKCFPFIVRQTHGAGVCRGIQRDCQLLAGAAPPLFAVVLLPQQVAIGPACLL